jgi:hypothetical protein
LSATYKLLSDILLSRLAPYAEEIITDHNVNFDATVQLMIIYSEPVKCLKNGNKMRQIIGYLDFKQAYDLGRSCTIMSLSFVSL